ncbi:MAG TPA: PadR family transcriptional regulator [Sphingomicrobium sp.]
MAFLRRSSPQTRAVLSALLTAGDKWRYGYDLMQETGLKSGTLYPLLMRLADHGLLETEWRPPVAPARTPRHMFRLTGEGKSTAHALLAVSSAAAQVARA